MAVGLLASEAQANVPFTTIDGTRPVRTVFVGNELSCQVRLSVDDVYDFFPSQTAPGDCGTFVSIGGTVYGPDFANHDSSAAPSYTPFSPISQSPVTGSGVAGDPLQVTTVVGAGALTVTETTSYVKGADTIHTTTAVTNGTGSQVNNVRVYRAGDCYLAGSDDGYGAVDGAGGVYCTASPNNSPAGRLIGFVPQTPDSHYVEGGFSEVWDMIDGTNFPDTAETDVYQDNGAGINWAAGGVAAGTTETFDSDLKVFAPDPYGGLTGVSLNAGGVQTQLSEDLTSVTIQVACNLPAGSLVPCDPLLTLSAQLGASGAADVPRKKAAATPTVLASGQATVSPGSAAPVTLAVSAEGQAALAQQQKLAAKAKKKAKQLKAKAKKLAAQAKKAKGAKAKKLKAASKKAKKQAKKQSKRAKTLLKPSAQVLVVNDRTGATETVPIGLSIP